MPPPISALRKFLRDVVITSPRECWRWDGYRNEHGYGIITHCRDYKRTGIGAHRFSYEFFNGPIPPGIKVCHRCDNPPCCNPDHLFLGTQSDNLLDASLKGRLKTGGGFKLTIEQIQEIENAPRVKGACYALAAQYGINYRSVHRIWRREHRRGQSAWRRTYMGKKVAGVEVVQS
jgi:hypothetical protein